MGKDTRFKKGNKAAVGNSGPPPVTDYEKEAALLLEWCQKDDSIHLAQFTLSRNTYATKLYEWRDRSPVFAEALKIAKDFITMRIREKLNNPLKNYDRMLAMRDITAHDILLKKEERADKEFESSLKQKEAEVQANTLAELAQMSKDGKLSQK